MAEPRSLSFDDVNHYVHMDDPGYEDLQNLCLSLASTMDAMKSEIAVLATWAFEEGYSEFEDGDPIDAIARKYKDNGSNDGPRL